VAARQTHNVSALIDAFIARFPDRPAVAVRGADGVRRFTYRDIGDMAARAAARLRGRGVGAGDRCALIAGNSAEWCAAYLGILRLGAIAVPFDTAYREQQAATLLADSGARVLVFAPKFEGLAGAMTGCTVVPIEALVEPGGQAAGTDAGVLPPSPATPSDPAVILYTSGTTADPKGVVLTHGNLLAECAGALKIVRVDERDSVLGVLPLFHSLAQTANLLLPFAIGARVVFLETLNTTELLRALAEEEISVFACVPQFFYLIHKRVMDEVRRAPLHVRVLFRLLLRVNHVLRAWGWNAGPRLFGRVHRALGPRMRILISGGSRFEPAVGGDLRDLGFVILQAYGLTETSGAATVGWPDDPIESVGRPLVGVDVRIAAREGGADDGEILIRGPIVMAGYWNKPEATAASLRDGWLHTGDLGRVDPQGRLTITGRSKEVIVLASGKNVYPEEIEAHYRQSVFVGELCVLGVRVPGQPSAERLHAVVVPDLEVLRERGIVNTRELIRFELETLSVALPSHKRVLSFDVVMEPLPRTTTGKLKRREIAPRRSREAAKAGAHVGASLSRPEGGEQDPTLARLVAAVRGALPGADVHPGSNFELDLGLDSMERVELLATLERRFGVRVSPEAAQRAFTVRDLAAAFREAAPGEQGEGLPWDRLLARETDASPELTELLKPRPLTAALFWVLGRLLSRGLGGTRIAGFEHLPAAGPFIICPNHQSYFDPFLMAPLLPFRVFRAQFSVGAAEYFQTPLTRWVASRLNVVPVDPDVNLLPAMQAAAFGLRHGRVLILFPEGERSIDGTVKPFRKGAAILARHLNVPVVPVAIAGAFEIWPRGRAFAWQRLLPWSGHRVHIAIGSSLRVGDGESDAAFTERLQTAVDQRWHPIERGPGSGTRGGQLSS